MNKMPTEEQFQEFRKEVYKLSKDRMQSALFYLFGADHELTTRAVKRAGKDWYKVPKERSLRQMTSKGTRGS